MVIVMRNYGDADEIKTFEQFSKELFEWMRQPVMECVSHTCSNCHGGGDSIITQRHICPICAGSGKQCIWEGKQ